MKWLKRGCWLAAWGVWLWLGFGLYRELPRDLGPVVCKLELGRGDNFIGWISNEPTAVTVSERDDESAIIVRTWDGITGRLRAEFKGPKNNGGFRSYDRCLHHGMLACRGRPDLPSRKRHRDWSMLNLRTGAWIDLECGIDDRISFAPSEPLALFAQSGDTRRVPHREQWQVVVIDLRNGTEVLRVADNVGNLPSREFLDKPFFLGNDAIVVQTVIKRDLDEIKSNDDRRAEVWRIDAPQKPHQVWPGIRIEDDPVAAANGRVAWHHCFTEPANVDVFDLNTGLEMLAYPPRVHRMEPEGFVEYHGPPRPGPVLSPDGRGVYLPRGNLALDIDAGTVCWRGSDDVSTQGVDQLGRIQLQERWHLPWLSHLPKLETYALRDLGSWRLIHRTWEPTWPSPRVSNPSPTWLLGKENEVYPLPPRVNYALLALCQSILALPLVLLWAVLRRRRKRRMRMANVLSFDRRNR